GVCVRLPSATTSRLPPCLSLTVPTAKPVVDFHHQVFTHAGRTPKKGTAKQKQCLEIFYLNNTKT
ncbi:hypothetical protein, partial [Enterococcus faecium]|uniref:hypothetical protein n=1 Tax=Enterococcus faecium TaxID=1352 RepID=UPI002931E958